jgi:putative transcriptional regulator
MVTNSLLKLKQPRAGYLIRTIREELNLTQEELARELGVTFPTVNRWENDRTQPSPMALRQVQLKLQEMGDVGTHILKRYSYEPI